MDTRSGLGVAAAGKLAADHADAVPLQFPLPNVVPSAAELTVTVTQPDGAGYVSLYPCSAAASNVPVPPAPTSTLNFTAGATVANTTIVSVDARALCVQASISATHIVIDLTGWWTLGSGAGFTAVAPSRVLDSQRHRGAGRRAATVGHAAREGDRYRRRSRTRRHRRGRQPDGHAAASAWLPRGVPVRRAATTDVEPQLRASDQTIAGYSIVPVAADGTICIRTYAPTHVVADVAGWLSLR